jgi:hypothetical protein
MAVSKAVGPSIWSQPKHRLDGRFFLCHVLSSPHAMVGRASGTFGSP